MSAVVAIMDRDDWDANTDNIVLVEPPRRRLLWVPRDLWCERLGDRINTAYKRGGHPLLIDALAEHCLRADTSVCLLRSATERALASLRITVPVECRLSFWYPLTPTSRLEEGHKVVVFEPPEEALAGERLHQWVGARRVPDGAGSDLERIERQKILVRRLLEDRFPLGRLLEDGALVTISDQRALDDLALVRPEWGLTTFSDVTPTIRDGKHVLVAWPRNPLSRGSRRVRRRINVIRRAAARAPRAG